MSALLRRDGPREDEEDPECPGPVGIGGWPGRGILVGAVAAVVIALVALWVWSPVWPGGEPWPFLWPIFPLGFLFLFVLIFVVVRSACWGWGWRTRGHWADAPSAREILRRRFARGELSRDQFREMDRELADGR